mmetsp:Transcript_39881/g.127810  ORF Transcript_39881/g.127810 Transcript_39881/m.127810 type:complete len:201 (-) Transcript_39881:3-605(-)
MGPTTSKVKRNNKTSSKKCKTNATEEVQVTFRGTRRATNKRPPQTSKVLSACKCMSMPTTSPSSMHCGARVEALKKIAHLLSPDPEGVSPSQARARQLGDARRRLSEAGNEGCERARSELPRALPSRGLDGLLKRPLVGTLLPSWGLRCRPRPTEESLRSRSNALAMSGQRPSAGGPSDAPAFGGAAPNGRCSLAWLHET